MSTSNRLESSVAMSAALPQKKEIPASSPTPPTGANNTGTVPSRCCAVSLSSGVSCTLAIFGLARDLHIHGTLYGLSIGTQNTIRIRAADHASTRDLKRHVQKFADKEDGITVLAPKTSTPPDYRSPEGRVLIGKVKPLEALIVAVPPAHKKVRWSDTDLNAFKEATESEGVLSIAVFQALSKDEELLLPTYFDAVFTVTPCEPDEGFASAHMASPMAGSLLAATGHQALIENIKLDAEGRIQRQCLPCVSADKLTREIYRLRKESRSLEEIGKTLGFDKSTISRRLSALPYHLRTHCV